MDFGASSDSTVNVIAAGQVGKERRQTEVTV